MRGKHAGSRFYCVLTVNIVRKRGFERIPALLGTALVTGRRVIQSRGYRALGYLRWDRLKLEH